MWRNGEDQEISPRFHREAMAMIMRAGFWVMEASRSRISSQRIPRGWMDSLAPLEPATIIENKLSRQSKDSTHWHRHDFSGMIGVHITTFLQHDFPYITRERLS
jgi:hypothetical protein